MHLQPLREWRNLYPQENIQGNEGCLGGLVGISHEFILGLLCWHARFERGFVTPEPTHLKSNVRISVCTSKYT